MAKAGFSWSLVISMARAARDFFKDFDILAPETQKISLGSVIRGGPRGAGKGPGSSLSPPKGSRRSIDLNITFS